MEFLNPWGWLGLLALPAIVALHFFRRRYQTKSVATVMFWRQLRETDTQGRTRKPIRSSLSLWLQLLAATLLTVLLAGPQTLKSTGEKEILIILDSAYSLQTRLSQDKTVADQIRAAVNSRLTTGRRYTVIEHGTTPRLLTARAAGLTEAREAVAAWQPAQPRADWQATFRLLELWDLDRCTLWVLTDNLTDAWKKVAGVELTALGGTADNLAIVEANRIRLPGTGQERLRASIHNFQTGRATGELQVRAGNQIVARQSFTIPAGNAWTFTADLPETNTPYVLELPDDALSFDNRVHLAPMLQPPVEILFDFTDAALGETWHRVVAAVAPTFRAGTNTATLILSDSPRWLTDETVSACVLVCASGATEAKLYRPPFLSESQHPLLRGLDWAGCLLAIGQWPGATVSNQLARVSARDVAVLTELPGRGSRRFVLHADIAKSNLAKQPAFPILAQNAVEIARSFQPGLRTPNLRFGETLEFRLPRDARELCLRQDGWQECAAQPAGLRLPADRVGLFEVVVGNETWPLAIHHVEVGTSDLRAIAGGDYRTPVTSTALMQRTLHDEWIIALIIALLAIIFGEWWLTGRRSA
ncbi:MAG: hypothetical protein PCFJNLEI_03124 [Verrucomicrobiae bacterium]|nr:hypothetical protein [Verrucomicrobiae bacterium]